MPFNRPTLQDLIDRARADIESRLPGADAGLRRTLLGVLARMHSGSVHGLYGYLDWLARQVMPDTAEAEHLARWAAIWGVDRREAVAASGDVIFSGTSGSVIPASTVLQRADGRAFATVADATIVSGSATVGVLDTEPGAAGLTDAGAAVSMVSPVSGVKAAAVVATGGLTGGADVESDDMLRRRLLFRIQQPPQGGSAADYVAWAMEVAGVTRVWVYPLEQGDGTVTVRFMMDDSYADGIPLSDDVAAVQDHIDPLRPVTAEVFVVAPVAMPLDLTLVVEPDTAAVRAAVTAEIADLIRRTAEPGGTILVSHIREAVSIAAGEQNHELLSPVADVIMAAGEIAVPGLITWS